MKFVTPRDWEATHHFAHLVVQCANAGLPAPRIAATYILFRLWTELSYQMSIHREPGRFDTSRADGFALLTETPGLKSSGLFGILELSGLLEPRDYGWFCPLFSADNYWTGHGWLDGDEKRRILSRWREGNDRATGKATQTVSAIIDESLWYLSTDGTKVSPEMMNAMIVLIRNADAICRMEEREPVDFTLGIMKAAFNVLATMKREHVELMLKRMYYLSRQVRPEFRIPKDSELLLIEFRKLVPVVCPEEIWKDWESSP